MLTRNWIDFACEPACASAPAQRLPAPHPTGPEAARLLDSVKQLPGALDRHTKAVEHLARSIEQAPGALTRDLPREVNAVRHAFDAGLATGGIAVAICCLVVLLIARR